MLEWFKDNPAVAWTVGIASVAIVVGSLVALPVIVARVPADYFNHARRPRDRKAGGGRSRVLLRVGKNVLGIVLILAGVAMLLLPGQGVLAIIVGLFLLDIPGKYRVEKWLVARPWVHKPMNWLRRRRGRPPIEVPGRSSSSSSRVAGVT